MLSTPLGRRQIARRPVERTKRDFGLVFADGKNAGAAIGAEASVGEGFVLPSALKSRDTPDREVIEIGPGDAPTIAAMAYSNTKWVPEYCETNAPTQAAAVQKSLSCLRRQLINRHAKPLPRSTDHATKPVVANNVPGGLQ